MKKIIPLLFLLSACQYFPEKLACIDDMKINHVVHVTNNSDTPLTCSRVEWKDDDQIYSKGFEISPHSSKYLRVCSYDDRYACSLKTGHENSTYLTYINPYMAGEYSVSLQEVHCASCSNGNSRLATVFKLPNRETTHTKYKNE